MPSRKPTVRQAGIVQAFAERLRGIRQARGLTQRELADKAHVTDTYISRLEAGASAPGIDTLDQLARALRVHVTELLPAPSGQDSLNDRQAGVKALFEAILPRAGLETLTMLDLLVSRLAESPAISR